MPLTITGATLDGNTVGLRADGGTIAAVGPEVQAEPGDEILDGRGRALVPGCVNGHTHAAMTLLRGFGDDMPLRQWLEECIWPAEARLTDEDVYWGTRLACLAMLRSGTTRFWDMYFFGPAVARAVVDSGLRATVSQGILEVPGAPAHVAIDAAVDGLDALAAAGPRVTPGLGPHSIYAVGERTLARVAELSTIRGVPVQIHLSETQHEVLDCIDAHGVRPAHHLDRLGLLTERTVLAHGVWLDDDELALVAARGATVVTNPVSNMKLAVGRAFPYPKAVAAGVRIGLGTDGAASNNSLDLFVDLKMLALLQKHAHGDPSVLPAGDAWAIATGAARRSRSARRPTSCSSTRMPSRSLPGRSSRTSSTPRAVRSSTASSSTGRCSCVPAWSRARTRCGPERASAHDACAADAAHVNPPT